MAKSKKPKVKKRADLIEIEEDVECLVEILNLQRILVNGLSEKIKMLRSKV